MHFICKLEIRITLKPAYNCFKKLCAINWSKKIVCEVVVADNPPPPPPTLP